ASVRAARISLTRRAGATIKRALKLRTRPRGRFGTASSEALVKGVGGDRGGGAPGGAPGSGGGPESGPISHEPPLLARPASAVEVSGLALRWYPRDSWLRYVNTSTASGDGVHATGGATAAAPSELSACPDTGGPTNPGFSYSFDYAPKSGWYDPASGHAGLYFQGAVSFTWKGHGIDLTASDPEIEVSDASRAIFRFSGSDGTAYPDQRAELVKLAATPQPGASGPLGYELAKGTLTADGASVFAGFYPVGGGFGCVSVSFTVL
ncbi:MAG TPA: HtaA domain-containing protein, partial [Thermoleophilaceae bacterium]